MRRLHSYLKELEELAVNRGKLTHETRNRLAVIKGNLDLIFIKNRGKILPDPLKTLLAKGRLLVDQISHKGDN